MATEPALVIFLIFVAVALIIAARTAIKSQKKQRAPKRMYRPYIPVSPPNQQQSSTRSTSPTITTPPRRQQRPVARPSTSSKSQSRADYASADEYFRAGLYDRAKDEYLKTGRIFGAAKSIAAKGKDSTQDAIAIISRYAPEREDEMVRNLSRYFFDSGDIEVSALILFEYGKRDEAEAVLAAIGKTLDDITEEKVVEVSQIPPSSTSSDDELSTSQTFDELSKIVDESKSFEVDTDKVVKVEKFDVDTKTKKKAKARQPLKVATSDLDERCSVCMSHIKAGDNFIRCPFCDTPSHYSHIIEWIKVKPQCPNCKQKLIARMFEGQ
ncbi:hypothetical protein ES705_19100 [subsurface metagenome]